MENLGLELKRQTMSNWILEASKEWLMPVVNLLHRKLLKEKYIHADETRIQVLIVETAKANGLNPYEYLRYILKFMHGLRFRILFSNKALNNYKY